MKTITILNLKDSTAQEVFDFIVNHLRTQNAKATQLSVKHNTEQCRYRTHDGKMCAAGCLIPENIYTEDIEGENWGSGTFDRLKVEWTNKHDRLIQAMQVIHDKYDIQTWEDQFVDLARKQNLIYTKSQAHENDKHS